MVAKRLPDNFIVDHNLLELLGILADSKPVSNNPTDGPDCAFEISNS